MAAWTLRCRGPAGQATLAGVGAATSVAELLSLLEQKTGAPAQEVLSGFPPKPLQVRVDSRHRPWTRWWLEMQGEARMGVRCARARALVSAGVRGRAHANS
jgi:hypothetical protein